MKDEIPITLYKYKDISGTGINHFEDMVLKNQIWFSSALDFNDPFDCRVVFDMSNSREDIVLRKTNFLIKKKELPQSEAYSIANNEIPLKQSELDEYQIAQFEEHSVRAANSGILCLTPVYNNFLMWSHYARDHTGICIKFRVIDEHEDSHIDFFAKIKCVKYADRCPVINIVKDSNEEIVSKAYFTKSTAYRYEQEWRIVLYDEGIGLKEIPQGIIGAVILGCQISSSDRERVISACTSYNGKIDIIESYLDPTTYGLNFKTIETV